MTLRWRSFGKAWVQEVPLRGVPKLVSRCWWFLMWGWIKTRDGMNIRLPAIFDVNDTPRWSLRRLFRDEDSTFQFLQGWSSKGPILRIAYGIAQGTVSRTLAPISSYILKNRCRHRHAVNSNKATPSKCNASFWWHLLKSAGNPILSETEQPIIVCWDDAASLSLPSV